MNIKQALQNAADGLLELDDIGGVVLVTLDGRGNIHQYSVGSDEQTSDTMYSIGNEMFHGDRGDATLH